MLEVRFRVDQGKHNAEIICLDIASKKEEKKREKFFAYPLISFTYFPFFVL
jgi:hypothetical protein